MSKRDVSPLVTIRVAESRDIEAIQRCRFDVYSEEGFIDPSSFPDGQEHDKYDDSSIHVVASTAPSVEAIGTTRVILGKYVTLPVQELPHNIAVSLPEKSCEISRLCVRDNFRNGRVSIGMYRALFHVIEMNNIEYIYAIVDEDFFDTLCWIGFPFVKIGKPKDHMGITVATLCLTSEVMPALRKNENANLLGVTALFERPFPDSLIM